MVRVIVTRKLLNDLKKKFKEETHKIIELFESLQVNPKKGKELGSVKGIVIKELKYKNFRFYCITEGYKLKILREEELNDLIIKFVRMSEKKTQQKTIDEIKTILKRLGKEGF